MTKVRDDLFDYGFRFAEIQPITLRNGQEIVWAGKADSDDPGKVARLGIAFNDSEGELVTAHLDALTGRIILGEMREDLTKSDKFDLLAHTFHSQADNP
ncbi:MAG: hypothetical protein AB7P52_05185 [Alphaproteobacteria bacterium]